MADLRVSEIKAMLQGQCPGLLHELVPGLRREGTVLSAPNPRRGDGRHGSFKVWPRLGAFREYDEPEDTGKGDILGLVAYINGHDPRSREGRRFALQWAKRRLGLDTMAAPQLMRVRRDLGAEAEKRRAAREAEEQRRAARLFTRGLDLWRAAVPGHPGIAAYLGARLGVPVMLGALVPALRLHPALDHWAMPHKGSGAAWRGPAVVARVTHPADGRFAAIHCTFLRDDFSGKAPMANAKLMLGPVSGAVVPLTLGAGGLTVAAARAAEHRTWLIAGEGLENSVAVALANPEARTWACLALGNLAHLPLDPAIMSGVVMTLDNETKPEAMASQATVIDRLAARCRAAGLRFETMRPPTGKGFAEMMQESDDGETGGGGDWRDGGAAGGAADGGADGDDGW